MQRRLLGLSWLALCWVAGCGSKEGATAPNLSDCTTCGRVNPGGTLQGSGEGGLESEAGDPGPPGRATDAGSISVTLSPVSVLSEATFSKDPITFTGPVKVSSFDPTGAVVDTGSTGVLLPEMLQGVAQGPNWFSVQDANQVVTIASTLQPREVGAKDSTVTLWALNAGQLAATNIDGELLMGSAQGQATVVLVLRRAGKSVPGIKVTGAPPSSTVAYYTGTPFPYQSQTRGTEATGAESTVMVTHVPVAAQFPNFNTLTLTCEIPNQAPLSVEVNIAQTFVTWIPVEVP